jgi:hypothetical protein
MNKYDIVIVAHEKDFNNIKHIVRQCSINLDFDSIHLILSERKEYEDMELLTTITTKPIYKHLETDVLKIDKNKINHRPNWIYQMLLKMLQNVTENDNFLIIEADCLILKNIEFFEKNKTIFYLCRDQYHQQYFNFSKKILNLDKSHPHSFISEFMIYDKKKINHMLKESNCENVTDFLELIYNNVDHNCYPADYELYGNFCIKYYPNDYLVKSLDYNFYGRESREAPFWSDDEINHLIEINKDKSTISFHTWGEN